MGYKFILWKMRNDPHSRTVFLVDDTAIDIVSDDPHAEHVRAKIPGYFQQSVHSAGRNFALRYISRKRPKSVMPKLFLPYYPN